MCLFFLSQQEAILEDLRTDIPVHFNFLFSDSHVEVISGKQEGKFRNYRAIFHFNIIVTLNILEHLHNNLICLCFRCLCMDWNKLCPWEV